MAPMDCYGRRLAVVAVSLLMLPMLPMLQAAPASALPLPLPDDAVTEGVNPAHTGEQVGVLAPPLQRSWQHAFPGLIRQVLAADGKVFVLAGDASGSRADLFALDATAGSVAWGPVSISDTFPYAYSAYDNGRLFVV